MIANQLLGMQFGRLKVIGSSRSDTNRIVWACICVCGNKSFVRGSHLKSGTVVSCGCHAADKARSRATHGLSRTTTHTIWKSMRARCNNKNTRGFEWYGGRGISVCEEWNSFDRFLSDMGVRPAGMSIDRIDNEKNYESGNCRWATNGEQSRNRRSNCNITFNGKTMCRKDWADYIGMTSEAIDRKIKKLGVDAAFAIFLRESQNVF